MPSPLTQVDIANRALTKIGERTISVLTEDNNRARVMNSIFEPVRDDLLRECPWNFALKDQTLSADPAAPLWGFAARFAFPADMLYMKATENLSPYRLQGNFIHSNVENSLNIKYVSKVTDTSQYDSAFVEAFAAKLAYEAAPRLSENQSQQETLFRDYNLALIKAKKFDGQEDDAQRQPEDAWLQARRSTAVSRGPIELDDGGGSL